MSKTLQSHQSPEEIHKHFMYNDLKRWQQEIEIVNVEMIFYRSLIESHLRAENTWHVDDYRHLFNAIKDVQRENADMQRKAQAFTRNLEGLAECEDLQCEHHFLNEHSLLKLEFERHFSSYQIFKKTILNYLKTKYNY